MVQFITPVFHRRHESSVTALCAIRYGDVRVCLLPGFCSHSVVCWLTIRSYISVRREYSVGCDGKLAIYVGEIQVWMTVVLRLITMSRCSPGGL